MLPFRACTAYYETGVERTSHFVVSRLRGQEFSEALFLSVTIQGTGFLFIRSQNSGLGNILSVLSFTSRGSAARLYRRLLLTPFNKQKLCSERMNRIIKVERCFNSW